MPLTEQAKAFLAAIAEANRPGWEELPPQEARDTFSGLVDLFGKGPDLARVEDKVLPGDIKVRLYSDSTSGAEPAVVFFHGGGWVLGNLDTHDALCRRIAKASGCTLISVDYALSPEARYPVALEQGYSVTQYVADHPDEVGVRGDCLAVAGDSAGGNLAASVAMKSRDEGGPEIRLQVLIYPVIEPNFDTDTYLQFAQDHGLSRTTMQYFWDQYLGDRVPDALAAPSTAKTLAGLPAAHVVTAEYDVLRNEGESYAARLESDGVATTKRRYDGNLHAFVHFAAAFEDGLDAANDIAKVLKTHLLET